ncbi:hypothetical protein CKO11_13390 [Rhodobacter sp. TJ_12]|uniref:alpha/beta fold hydrolase n=1 Tax=Rhodobacter sp. TJ_12 TaxID=2029399 RepID=UPI001CBF3800|nr:alpha/beta hydrolase [Rhodobacter sp. TJ_12]MBZ4023451.1 hypothetical protein [Rhodobacter sp. TJ_12]
MSAVALAPDRFADLTGGRICYRDDGAPNAPAVFLIAGLGMQLIEWPDTLVAGLAARFRVIRLDNRDSGLSARCGGPFTQIPAGFSWAGSAPALAPYDLTHLAQDVLDLADHLHIGRFAAIGFSMGGMIAQLLAVQAPQRLTGLISLSSTGGDANITADAASMQLMERFFLPFPSEAAGIATICASNAHFSLGQMPLHSAENRDLATALIRRALDNGGYLRQALAITTTPPWKAALTRQTIPALLVHGAQDPCIHSSAAQDLAAEMPNAQFSLRPGLGHWMDDQTGRACLDWLMRHAPAPNAIL